jgi:hypothetical protein
MNVVGPGDLRVGSFGLERFGYDLELKFSGCRCVVPWCVSLDWLRFTGNQTSCVSASVLVDLPVQLFGRTSKSLAGLLAVFDLKDFQEVVPGLIRLLYSREMVQCRFKSTPPYRPSSADKRRALIDG